MPLLQQRLPQQTVGLYILREMLENVPAMADDFCRSLLFEHPA